MAISREPTSTNSISTSDEIRDRLCRGQIEQQVNVIGVSANDDRLSTAVADDSAEVGVTFRSELAVEVGGNDPSC